MTIQRVPEVPFAQIANQALRDIRLSFKARGILALVLSHSGEWRATVDWLERQSSNDGRGSIQSGLRELTELGYRQVIREQVDGKIRTVVVWKHTPDNAISRPTENPTDTILDHQETMPSIEHNSKEHNALENNKESRRSDFDDFWSAYPRKAAKGAAVKAWSAALKVADARTIIEGAIRYGNDPNRDPAFTAHPASWLNSQRWLDEPLPAKRTGGDKRMNKYQQLFDSLGGSDDGAGSRSITSFPE